MTATIEERREVAIAAYRKMTGSEPGPDALAAIDGSLGIPPAAQPAAPPAVTTLGGPVSVSVDEVIADLMRNELWRREARRRADDYEHAKGWTPPAEVGSLAHWLTQPRRPARWRLEGVMEVGHNAALIAARKAGKTTLIGNLVRSYVDGYPFLNRFPVTPTGRGIAVFNYEVGADQYLDWLRETGIAATDRVFPLNLRGLTLPLTNPRVAAWVADWLRVRDIGMWVLDPYAAAYGGSVDNPNDEAQVGRFFREGVDAIKASAGVDEAVIAAHTPKAKAEAGDETANGSGRLEGWADTLWYLIRDRVLDTRFLRVEGRDTEVAESPLHYDQATRTLALDLDGGSRHKMRETADAEALTAYVTAHPGQGANEIAEGLGWTSTNRVKAARAATRGGVVVVQEANRKQAHYIAEVDFDG